MRYLIKLQPVQPEQPALIVQGRTRQAAIKAAAKATHLEDAQFADLRPGYIVVFPQVKVGLYGYLYAHMEQMA